MSSGPDTPTRGEGLRAAAVAGVLWSALQKWTVRLSTFVAFLLLGRLLTPKDFGVVAVATVFLSFMTTLADAGFATYLVQAKTLTDEAKNTAFYIATSSGLALFGLGIVIAGPLAGALGTPELRTVLPALAAPLILVGLSSVPAALLTRELQFQALAVRQVLANVLSVIAAVALAFAGAGVWALVAQLIVLRVVSTLALVFATDFRPHRAFSRTEARIMLAYSLKAMGAQLLQQARDQGEILVLGIVAGPTALGLWVVASRLVFVVTDLLGSVVGSVAVPLFARVQSEPLRLGRAISGTSGLAMLILGPSLVLLALLSPELVPDVFGQQWNGAGPVAAVLALRGIVVALAALDRVVLLNAGRAGGELVTVAVLTLLHIGVVAAFASGGLELLAGIVLLEAVLLTPLRPVLIHRWLGVPYDAYAAVVRVLGATAVSGGLAYGALAAFEVQGSASYLVVGVVGVLSYPALTVLLARPVLREASEAVALLRRRRTVTA